MTHIKPKKQTVPGKGRYPYWDDALVRYERNVNNSYDWLWYVGQRTHPETGSIRSPPIMPSYADMADGGPYAPEHAKPL